MTLDDRALRTIDGLGLSALAEGVYERLATVTVSRPLTGERSRT